jgi:hypothetical protein
VSTQSILHRHDDGALLALLRPEPNTAPFVELDAKSPRRCKIWDLSTNLHCSIIGTCLTAGELRQFFVRLREPDARSATDHALHGRAVSAAGRHDLQGKLLHKALDARHEAAIKRFVKAATAVEVKALWRQALEEGAIPGAYWAVLTHPATDHALLQDVFGQVHMLSHQVGASNRLDIARLRKLEEEIAERDAKIARQELRLQAAARNRDELAGRIADLEAAMVRLDAATQAKRPESASDAAAARLQQRLAEEQSHSGAQAERLSALEARAREADGQVAALTQKNGRLERELAFLEETMGRDGADGPPADAIAGGLRGRRLLYVGGRPKLVDQLKAMAAQRDGVLLAHDGGREDNAALLPGLVSQADSVFFPVDCISHDAAGRVKKLCRRLGKPFVPLRTASLAAFFAALAAGDGEVPGDAEGFAAE